MNRTEQENVCFKITGALEGGAGFLNLAGNFDGQGWSIGFLQWPMGQGNAQALLLDMYQAGPVTFRRHLPGGMADELLKVCKGDRKAAVAWCDVRSTGTGKRRIVEPWNTALKNLLAEPGFQDIQRKHAARYLDDARRDAEHYKISTVRGLALMFDTSVQCGVNRLGFGGSEKTRAMFQGKGGYALPYQERLLALADAVAESADPRWVEDVRSRKRLIVTGSGKVHGKTWNLAASFGLNDEALV